MSIALYLTDSDEHTTIYEINKNVYIRILKIKIL